MTSNSDKKSTTLETHGLTIAFGSKAIVSDVSMRISRGEIVGLSGPSGSGKSLTLWSLLGLLPSSATMSGSFTMYNASGSKIDICNPGEARRLCGREVVMIPQNPFTSLNPVMKCGYQIAESAPQDGVSGKALRGRIVSHLGQFGFEDPERIYEAYPFELSGGQLQRVVVAMATVGNPGLILADEPTTALDARTQREVLVVLRDWVKAHAKSMLLVSHDQTVLRQYCDRIYVLHQGVVTESTGSSDKRDEISQHPKEQGLRLPEVCTFTEVSVRFRSRSGKHVQALQDVSFDLRQQEILGIIGSTGSGKSTIAKVLSGLVLPQSGSVECAGMSLDFRQYPVLRRKIQMVFQDPYSALYPHWTAGAYLREAIRLHQIVPLDKEEALVQRVLMDVGLNQEFAARYPHQLSGGERQRIQIARAILIKPTILICDEITSGLDAPIQKQILELLTRLYRAYEMSIIFISHDLQIVRRIAHRVLILQEGKVVDIGDTATIFAAQAHDLTRHDSGARG